VVERQRKTVYKLTPSLPMGRLAPLPSDILDGTGIIIVVGWKE